MPTTCCVPGCKSNYNSVLKREQKGKLISIFQFPRDDNLRQKWLNAIRRANFIPSKTAVVCGKHFLDGDIIRDDDYLQPDGTLTKIPIKARLKPNACPSIFPNLPAPTPRKSYNRRRKQHMECANKWSDMFEKADIRLEPDMQTSVKEESNGVAKKLKANLSEIQDYAADDGAVASTSRDFVVPYKTLSSLEEDDSDEDDVSDRQPTLVDQSIVKIETEEVPLKIENDPITPDTREELTPTLLPFIKDEPSEESGLIAPKTVDQLNESERESIQFFFDSMARTVMNLPPAFASKIKSEVLRVVMDMEMEARNEKMQQSNIPSRKTEMDTATSTETEPKIEIEIEHDEEVEVQNEPESSDLDHETNYEPLTKKRKKSNSEQTKPSTSALTVNRTPRTLHEPVETFFQRIASTVKSFPPPFVCKAKLAVLKVVSKIEVEACRSHQSGYRDGGGGGDDGSTRPLLASSSNYQ